MFKQPCSAEILEYIFSLFFKLDYLSSMAKIVYNYEMALIIKIVRKNTPKSFVRPGPIFTTLHFSLITYKCVQ
jgi:hypothetical protein